MAFKVVTSSPNIPVEIGVADASVAFTRGFLVYRDTSSGELKEATTTTGDATNIEGIVKESVTTPSTNPTIDYIPVFHQTRVVVDCTNNTAANQLNKAHLLTDGGTVNNTSSHSTDINAIFIALGIVGEATDKKLYGYIAKTGQVTA